jgi:hypothetical protein
MEGDIFAGLSSVSSSPIDLSETFSWSTERNPSSPYAFPLQSNEKENTADESQEVKYNYDAMHPPPSLSTIPCQNPTNHLT